MEGIVIVIAGPTCSGKTQVGLELAAHLGSEIISADSRQVFKYLNIGTAKPNPSELSRIKHHFVDAISPNELFNVSKFEEESLRIVYELSSKNKIPIVVGGSGLYIKALVDGIFNSVDTDEDYREELKLMREKFGNEYIFEELKKVDPESATKMLPQNWKRVMRALEVFHITGEPISKFQNEYKRETDFNFVQFGLDWDRNILYKNIEARVDDMINDGLVDEVSSVLKLGFEENINSLNTVGYKEIISYLKNEISLDRAVELIKRNTRRFAKRQLTWFRKDERINWIQINSKEFLQNVPGIILRKCNLV